MQSFTEKYQLHHRSKPALPHLQHSLLPTNPPLPTNVACLEEKNPQNFHTKAGTCRQCRSLQKMSKVYGFAKVSLGQNRSATVSTPLFVRVPFLLKKHVRQIEARQNHELCTSSQKSFIFKTFPPQVEEQGTRIVSWLQVEGLHILSAGGPRN